MVPSLRQGLKKTRYALRSRLQSVFSADSGKQMLERMEEVLLEADLGMKMTATVLDSLEPLIDRGQIAGFDDFERSVKDRLTEACRVRDQSRFPSPDTPHVVMVVGVNGVGKTTTIAKLAHWYGARGDEVILSAADTYRAAAIDQLKIWAERIGVEVIAHQPGADPAAVVFDSLEAAQARHTQEVIIDTAGRLHVNKNLMQELQKIQRTAGRKIEGAPHEVLLVLDATTGQNGYHQAERFVEVCGVTGLVLAKLDGTARGGIAISVTHDLGIPIKFLGVGEGVDDLIAFSPASFVKHLF